MKLTRLALVSVVSLVLSCGSDVGKPARDATPSAAGTGAGGAGGSSGGGGGSAGAGGAAGGRAGSGGGAGTGGGGGSITPRPDAAATPDAAPAGADARPANGADTYTNFARQFFTDYCVDCHPKAGQSAKDLTSYAGVIMFKTKIACGVTPSMATWTELGCSGFPPPGQFPVGSKKPTADLRDRLVRWIVAGAPM
jgi:hypothetical protein